MAINYIQGQILANNLQRNGIDLAFDTDLVYLDVGGNRVGINTTSPVSTLEVVGNITIGNILIPNVGNVNLANTYINNLLDPVTNLANGNITLTATGTELVTISGTAAFIMPAGNTAQRPSSGNVAGTLRFNTDIGRMEVYDGTEWDQVVGGVTNQTITTADGSTSTFALDRRTTTAATLVMLNGVVQLPVTAYNITGAGGNVLDFTEAPAVSDIIDVRFL